MPAYFDQGFCVRTPSWHGQETLLADYPQDWNEARKLAGLDWDPTTVPVFAEVPADAAKPVFAYSGIGSNGRLVNEPSEDDITGRWEKQTVAYVADPGHVRVVRSDNGALLDVTNESRSNITNTEWVEFNKAITEFAPDALIDTMGSVKGGGITFAGILLAQPYQIPGDESFTFPYIASMNHHTDGGGMRAGLTNIRAVCANTVSAAEAEMDHHGFAVTIRHTKNWRDKVDEARKVIFGLQKATDEYKSIMTDLAGMPVTDDQVESFIQVFIPSPVETQVSRTVQAHIARDRGMLRQALYSATAAGTEGTAYWLAQGGIEFSDHYRGFRNLDTKVGRQLLKPQKMKGEAVKYARMAAAGVL